MVSRSMRFVLPMFVLVILFLQVPCITSADVETETHTIREGSYESVLIDADDDDIWYRVQVISGGQVDVYMSYDFQFGFPTSYFDPVSGHTHEGVMRVEDTLKGGDEPLGEGLVWLIVDNSDSIGYPSEGNTTVRIEWERRMNFSLLVPGLIVIIAIGVGLAVLWAKKRSDARRPRISDQETAMELQRVLSQDEAVGAGGEDPGTGAFCMGCGAEKKKNLQTGRIYCPNCERI